MPFLVDIGDSRRALIGCLVRQASRHEAWFQAGLIGSEDADAIGSEMLAIMCLLFNRQSFPTPGRGHGEGAKSRSREDGVCYHLEAFPRAYSPSSTSRRMAPLAANIHTFGRRFKPASTRRRIASDRLMSCLVAQVSSLDRTEVGSLTKTPGSTPPALGGRPRRFLISDIDEGITLLISEKRAERKL
jgi:hypothetical protein